MSDWPALTQANRPVSKRQQCQQMPVSGAPSSVNTLFLTSCYAPRPHEPFTHHQPKTHAGTCAQQTPESSLLFLFFPRALLLPNHLNYVSARLFLHTEQRLSTPRLWQRRSNLNIILTLIQFYSYNFTFFFFRSSKSDIFTFRRWG